MARAAANNAPKTIDLVGPDGETTRKGVVVDSAEEISLRFDGYLPADQAKLEAPAKPNPAEQSPTTVTNP